ncbi:hypothetical protein [Priestia aryabhattai]|uniref:hypothetical protein n=1 Tax=Priestia aryabhattai TaxID=412384 RepID=UPI001C8F1CC1|nr:hypothetical protein [Priestia aryabhattai]MBY0213872.1 hypothetical protein [Priestia aryabhattai]
MVINWTMGITIMGSFGAAILGQMAANFFTNRRENKKYDKECFQNLYSPLVFRIVEYVYNESYKVIEMESESFNENEFEKNALNPEPIFEEIVEYMGKNLKYVHPELIMIYEEVKAITVLFREDKEDPSIILEQRINLCREFLIEYNKLSNKLNILSQTVEDRIKVPIFLTEFYFLLNQCQLWNLTERSLRDLALIEMIVLHKVDKEDENNTYLLNKIMKINKEIVHVTNTKTFQNRYDDAFTDAYQLLNEIVDEFSSVPAAEDTAKYWKDALEKEFKNKNSSKLIG